MPKSRRTIRRSPCTPTRPCSSRRMARRRTCATRRRWTSTTRGPSARDRAEDESVSAQYVVARHDRLRGSRSQRHVERRSRLRPRLGADARRRRTGRRTATAAGRGSSLTDGRGSTMRRGASRPSTTAAGRTCATAGCGRRARCVVVPSTLPRSSCSLAATTSAATHWGRARRRRVVPARAERGLSPRVSRERSATCAA